MNKLVKKFFMTFAFACLFIVGGTTLVSAKTLHGPDYLKNVNVSKGASEDEGKSHMFPYTVTNQQDGFGNSSMTYYIVDSLDTKINLKFKKNTDRHYNETINYNPTIDIVKCSGFTRDCIGAKYVTIPANQLVDKLSNKGNGYDLDLKSFPDSSYQNTSNVAGIDVTKLFSDYKCGDATYFIIVEMNADYLFQSYRFYEVIRIVDLSKIGGGPSYEYERIESTNEVKVTVTSSVPLNDEVKYFITDQEFKGENAIKNNEDFDNKANEVGAQVNTITITNNLPSPAPIGSNRTGFVYKTEFTVSVEEGKQCYLSINDEFGLGQYPNVAVDDEVEPNPDPTPNPIIPDSGEGNKPQANDTQVGKIILYVLLGVLVLAAVLLIIQKIVDQRRKLY